MREHKRKLALFTMDNIPRKVGCGCQEGAGFGIQRESGVRFTELKEGRRVGRCA